MNRRKFILRSGLAIGATSLLDSCTSNESAALSLDDWAGVRAQFQLSPDKIHMSQMFLASHPRPVTEEIERHRKNFDDDPIGYWESNYTTAEVIVQQAAAKYVQSDAKEIALTDSTTMGLAMLYNGLRLKPGDEILTSTHDHYSTEKSLEFAAQKKGASIRKITLYQDPAGATVDEVVSAVQKAIRPATRVVALTWVHSGTGVKLPIRAIADVIKAVNAQRTAVDRIYFCVDGVHGFGIENVTMADLGCDFFAAGTHKWIFGPRGTGILFGRQDAWGLVEPTIPAFSFAAYGMWLGMVPEGKIGFDEWCTPGGFHSFEHRWALNTAFEFQMKIGKARVEERTRQLSRLLKDGLKEIKHVKLYTPVSEELSAGINCFDVVGMKAEEVVKKLYDQHKIVASTSPYRTSNARLTPSIVNSEEEVMTCLRAVENIIA